MGGAQHDAQPHLGAVCANPIGREDVMDEAGERKCQR